LHGVQVMGVTGSSVTDTEVVVVLVDLLVVVVFAA
jgi:hypothetical protein